MRTIRLADFLAGREARAQRAGVVFTPERNEALRNKGERRTPEKRATLARIEQRFVGAGIAPRQSD